MLCYISCGIGKYILSLFEESKQCFALSRRRRRLWLTSCSIFTFRSTLFCGINLVEGRTSNDFVPACLYTCCRVVFDSVLTSGPWTRGRVCDHHLPYPFKHSPFSPDSRSQAVHNDNKENNRVAKLQQRLLVDVADPIINSTVI